MFNVTNNRKEASSIVPFDSGKSYIVRNLPVYRYGQNVITDSLGRTEEDRKYVKQFERIFLAAGSGDLKECQTVVADGFHDFHATSYGKFGTESGKMLNNISPIQIAEKHEHVHITNYFKQLLGMTPTVIPPSTSLSAPQYLPKVLENSPNGIFFEKPISLVVNELCVNHFSNEEKINVLIKDLDTYGLCVALGKFGPNFYSNESLFKLNDKFCDQEIYGWKPGSIHAEGVNCHIIIIGAKKIAEKEYVYFTLCEANHNSEKFINNYTTVKNDSKIYVISYKNFKNNLISIFRPVKPRETSNTSNLVSCASRDLEKFSSSERAYIEKLCALMPLDSILDEGAGEKQCKDIGQEIFDKYKNESNGNSFIGKETVQKICDVIKLVAKDGKLRKQYIERAWDNIGDKTWQWMA